jgi:hypothetical protein
MSKMGSLEPFGHLKHKLWPKERPGNRSNSLVSRWHVTYHWKAFNEGYNFASNLISIEGLHRKLCAPKVIGVPTLGISRLPLGNPGTKCHLDVGPMARHKVYYKGEGSGFPQVLDVVSLVSPSCSWWVLGSKVLQLNINQLVVWFCASSCEWMNYLSFFPIPSRNSNMPLYPQSVMS